MSRVENISLPSIDKENIKNTDILNAKGKRFNNSPRKSNCDSPRRSALSILKGVFSPSKSKSSNKENKTKPQPSSSAENISITPRTIKFDDDVINQDKDKKDVSVQKSDIVDKKTITTGSHPSFSYVSTPFPFKRSLNLNSPTERKTKKRLNESYIESSPKRRRTSYGKTKSNVNDDLFSYSLNQSLSRSMTKKILNVNNSDPDKPMSMEDILSYVIFGQDEIESMKSFILAYPHFKWTPKEKFQSLWNLYRNPPLKYWRVNSTRADQRVKVIKYLLLWMQLSVSDFNLESDSSDNRVPFKYYRNFLELIKADEIDIDELTVKLPRLDDKEFYPASSKQASRRKSLNRRSSIGHRRQHSIIRQKESNLDPLNFAIQLARYEFNIFKRIKPSELINQSWNKEGCEINAPNVVQIIKHFNKISNWVSREIIEAETLKDQAKKIEKFIMIAKKSKNIGNYNGLMEIISGLSSIDVQRLVNAWKLVPEKQTTRLKKLESLISPSQNFREYRLKLEMTKGFVVPYTGIHLGDIVHIVEGYVETCKGYYDINKVLQLGSMLLQWREWQNQVIDVEEDPSFIQFVNSLKE